MRWRVFRIQSSLKRPTVSLTLTSVHLYWKFCLSVYECVWLMNHPHPLPHKQMREVLILINSHRCAGSWVMMTGWPVRSSLIYSFVRRDFQPHGAKAQLLHHRDRESSSLSLVHTHTPHKWRRASAWFSHYASVSSTYCSDHNILYIVYRFSINWNYLRV